MGIEYRRQATDRVRAFGLRDLGRQQRHCQDPGEAETGREGPGRGEPARGERGAVRKFKQGNGVVPDIIQLIGHGTPGRLALGSYWSGKVKDPKLGYAVLDSNPESYGMLRNETPSTARIFLLGCCVGSSEPSGYVASGRALLFDLEDMTGANVYAADDLVHPGLFVNGLYTGSLVTSSGKPANPAVLPFAPDIRATTFSEKANAIPALAGVLSSPALGFQVDLIAPGHSFIDLFKDYSLALPQPEGLLAMSEIEFEAAGYSRVDAICGLRYVRFQVAGGDTKYYERPTGSKPIDLGRQGDPAPALKALKDDYLAQLA